MFKVVFVGPSLYGVAEKPADVKFRAPAAHGDITRAVEEGADVIGLVDGCFETVASVWHKEILFALSRNVRMLGAASMGALRAAECAAFGMLPVGAIANAYLTGEFDDDAAVALTSLPKEGGYMPLVEPLVEVLPTLEKMHEYKAITSGEHESLLAAAERTYFAERTVEVFVHQGVDCDRTQPVARAYRALKVNQKRIDALELLSLLGDLSQRGRVPSWELAESLFWQRAHGRATSLTLD